MGCMAAGQQWMDGRAPRRYVAPARQTCGSCRDTESVGEWHPLQEFLRGPRWLQALRRLALHFRDPQ